MHKVMRALILALVSFAMAHGVNAADGPQISVKKTATCGCCSAWIDHLRSAGHKVSAENVSYGLLSRFKTKNGISSALASCHTATVGGYTIEGHVPVREIRRLLKEKPDAIGLTVPGMPIGSPGMEVDTRRDAYDVLLIRRDGSTEVYAHYPAKG
jgi:hypothetical protein